MTSNASPAIPPCVILLTGFPGVGKFTIAKALVSLLKQLPTPPSIRSIDNHLLIDPVQAIEPGRTPEHYALRKQFRQVAFNALRTAPDPGLVIIFTACLAASENDVEQFIEYAELARARGVPLYSFTITCDESVNARRMMSEERAHWKSKLVDGSVLEKLRKDFRLLDPHEIDIKGRGVRIHHQVVDTTTFSAEEATARIYEWLVGYTRDLPLHAIRAW